MTVGQHLSIAVVGDESLTVQCALLARAAGHEVVLVATRSGAVRSEAEAAGLPVVDAGRLGEELEARPVDALLSIANEHVIAPDVLERARVAVNFHDGPLPAYAGLGVTTWALFDGARTHGVTWHRMTAEVDAGEVLVAEEFEIRPDDTALSLNARCYEAGLATFPQLLDRLAAGGEGVAVGPPERFSGRYDRPLAWLDPAVPAAELERAVRALDLGPRIRNRMGSVRWLLRDELLVVTALDVCRGAGAPAGTVVSVDDDGIRITTVDDDVVVTGLAAPDGTVLAPLDVADRAGVRAGERLEGPEAELVDALAATDPGLARHETHWSRRLGAVTTELPAHLGPVDPSHVSLFDVAVPEAATVEHRLAAVAAWWARTCGTERATFSFEDPTTAAAVARLDPLARHPVGALRVATDTSMADLVAAAGTEVLDLVRRGPLLADLVGRVPSLRCTATTPVLHVRVGAADGSPGPVGSAVVVTIPEQGGSLQVAVDADPATVPAWCRMPEQVRALVAAALDAPDQPARTVPIVVGSEREQLDEWNATSRDHDRSLTIDAAFRARVALSPQSPALSCGATTLTYAELAARVDQFAHRLRAAGAGPGELVGIALARDVDLVVAVLATSSTGAAYVPLDPDYPETRLRAMVDDADLTVVVADESTASRLGAGHRPVLHPGVTGAEPDEAVGLDPIGAHGPSDVAYVIYTSGSTGTPKGVVVEHRNVVNFFAAMDDVIDHDPPGTWLAVTSLSFDISVLELLWTLTRGFHVALQTRSISSSAAGSAPARRAPSWSLFYFAAGHEQAAEGYRLLLEGARFADEHGFEAVWLPERHFHEFGGAYPNPSVAAAAVAAVTTRVGIRAGSVVLPLHASARVAEEWAVVDNLSRGRVGISFAPGWQPRDFVLNPAAHGTARADLPRKIDEVRALWRGDPVEMPGPDGEPIEVATLPRPVQPELPTWLTSAGTTATFEQAGRSGLNLLTHLLGQSIEQLASNVDVYRRAWRDAGHPGDGHVTLMLHTHLDDDAEVARRRAEGPMRSYLGTATGLIKNMASAFPTFANAGADADEAFRSLSAEEMDQLLTMAAARYMETSGLFGTADDAADLVGSLAAVGVDEVACLVDFGIETDDVLRSLDHIAEAKRMVDERVGSPAEHADGALAGHGEGMAALVARHGVTHLQCTPSLAEILLADPDDRAALARLRHLLVGGEALGEKLARDLRTVLTGRLTNMYGPTETTIWSLVHELDVPPDGPVPIGRPIANTEIHVLDEAGAEVSIGALGELHIGGEGVARGYLRRPELTAERFVERPGRGRTYATGDLVSMRPDGVVDFAGRVDFQVKIRGHRIELGEIEAALEAHPDVDRAVVVARGAGGDARLVAFVRPASGRTADGAALVDHLRRLLPAVMVPDGVGVLDELPLTPNGKVDRQALPEAVDGSHPALAASEVPAGELEELVAAAWSERLHRPVGRTDNVFDVGGNSLLAVAVFRHLQSATGLPVVLTDLFRYPTVATLAVHLGALSHGGGAPDEPERTPTSGADRGELRRRARASGRGGQ